MGHTGLITRQSRDSRGLHEALQSHTVLYLLTRAPSRTQTTLADLQWTNKSSQQKQTTQNYLILKVKLDSVLNLVLCAVLGNLWSGGTTRRLHWQCTDFTTLRELISISCAGIYYSSNFICLMPLIGVGIICTGGYSEVADSNCSSDHSVLAGSSCSSNCSVTAGSNWSSDCSVIANSTWSSDWSAEKHCSEDMDCSVKTGPSCSWLIVPSNNGTLGCNCSEELAWRASSPICIKNIF